MAFLQLSYTGQYLSVKPNSDIKKVGKHVFWITAYQKLDIVRKFYKPLVVEVEVVADCALSSPKNV